MKRDLQSTHGQVFDLLIIGGGINGLTCARDAALRGLKVTVIEQKDFGGQTSSNSAKIAHCGMRYLQHLDFPRMKESIRERNIFHQLAPHLVKSQPFLMPIYGHGVKGKEILTLYMKIYDLLSPERKRFNDDYRKVPNSKIISPEEVLKITSDIKTDGLTGGVVWYEGQIQNTERLSLSILASAEEHGAKFFNYMKISRLENEGAKITGAKVMDLLSGETITIKSRFVLNATGPWATKIYDLTDLQIKDHGIYASKAFSLITQPVSKKYAITFPIKQMYKDKKAVINKKSSLQFAIPWRGKSMFASLHSSCDEDPENVSISEKEINTYIDYINDGFPGIKLKRDDVEHILWGIIPAESKGSAAPLKQYKIIDHLDKDGILGFGTVIGVKLTTARDVAEKTIDMIEKQLNNNNTATKTKTLPLWGGDIKYFNDFVENSLIKYKDKYSQEVIINLIKTYGSKCSEILALSDRDPELSTTIGDTAVIAAQVAYAVKKELAETLSDIIYRRTDLGSLGYPGDNVLSQCAEIMGNEKNWDAVKKQQEIDLVKQSYMILRNNH